MVSVYYKQTNNLITRYLDTEYVNGEHVLVNSYEHEESSYSYGAELTSVTNIKKWWDVTANVNIYSSEINTSNIASATPQNSIISWFGKLNTDFKLKNNLTFQLSGNYQSKTNLPVNQPQSFM